MFSTACSYQEVDIDEVKIKQDIVEAGEEMWQDSNENVYFNKIKQEIISSNIDGQQDTHETNSASEMTKVTISNNNLTNIIKQEQQEIDGEISRMLKSSVDSLKLFSNPMSFHDTESTKPIEETDIELEHDTIIFKSEPEDYVHEMSTSSNDNTEILSVGVDRNIKPSSCKAKINSKVYRCKTCDFEAKYEDYRQHKLSPCINNLCKKNEYFCSKCNRNFNNMTKFTSHYALYHGLKKNTCPQCKEHFACVATLRIHLISHINRLFLYEHNFNMDSEMILNECRRCRENVETKDCFLHWQLHLPDNLDEPSDQTSDETYRVYKKPDPIMDPNLLKKVLETLSNPKNKTKICIICRRYFRYNHEIKRHLVEHLHSTALTTSFDDIGLKCQLCSEVFNHASCYKCHMRTHFLLRDYECNLCKMTFAASSNLSKHKKIYHFAGSVCHICQQKFQKESSLEKHMLKKHLKSTVTLQMLPQSVLL